MFWVCSAICLCQNMEQHLIKFKNALLMVINFLRLRISFNFRMYKLVSRKGLKALDEKLKQSTGTYLLYVLYR